MKVKLEDFALQYQWPNVYFITLLVIFSKFHPMIFKSAAKLGINSYIPQINYLYPMAPRIAYAFDP